MASTPGLSVGSGDGDAGLASWGWHLPLRITRWADAATDDDAGHADRHGNCAAPDAGADQHTDTPASADAQTDGHAGADLRGGQRHVPAGYGDQYANEDRDDGTSANADGLRHTVPTRRTAGTVQAG